MGQGIRQLTHIGIRVRVQAHCRPACHGHHEAAHALISRPRRHCFGSTDVPAQALAYRTGYLKFTELRASAEDKLGAIFDIRDFHEVALGGTAHAPGALSRPIPGLNGRPRVSQASSLP
jgi:hypothetical protein